ncbi:MAG TPA: hypothetical protein VNO30_21750 [Kofleriaceae bacterium]|nr:hypothetical protein [Kofleriaceae bacterium]
MGIFRGPLTAALVGFSIATPSAAALVGSSVATPPASRHSRSDYKHPVG